MNAKTLSWITIVLLVAVIAIVLFVPKKVDSDGKVRVFGGSENEKSLETENPE